MVKPNLLVLMVTLLPLGAYASVQDASPMLARGNCQAAIPVLRDNITNDKSEAPYKLALCLMRTAPEEIVEIEHLLKTASNAGNSRADLSLGLLYRDMGDERRAREAFVRAEKGGSLMAGAWLRGQQAGDKRMPDAQSRLLSAIGRGDLAALKRLRTTTTVPPRTLYLAVQTGHEDVALWLLDRLAEIGADTRRRCLAVAIDRHMDTLATRLIAASTAAELNTPLAPFDLPLTLAIRTGADAIVRRLLDAGADPRVDAEDGRDAITLSWDGRLAGATRVLNSRGYPPRRILLDYLEGLRRQKQGPFAGQSLMFVAIRSHDEELVARLLKKEQDPWHTVGTESSVGEALYLWDLSRAASGLIDSGMPLHAFTSLVDSTIECDDVTTLRLLLHAKPFSPGDYERIEETPLWQSTAAASEIWHATLDWQGVDRRKGTRGRNVLMHAVLAGNNKLAEALAVGGFPLTDTDNNGRSAHWYAANAGAKGLLAKLIVIDNMLNYADASGQSPLMRAVIHGDSQTVQAILRLGADVNQRTVEGNTALMLAARDRPEIVSLLLGANADYAIRNNESITPLMVAARENCITCAQLLLDAGANPARKDARGRSARDLASDQNLLRMLR